MVYTETINDSTNATLAYVDTLFREVFDLARPYKSIGSVLSAQDAQLISMKFGDGVNNLRAALDHVVWRIALAYNPSVITDSSRFSLGWPVKWRKRDWDAFKQTHANNLPSFFFDFAENLQPFYYETNDLSELRSFNYAGANVLLSNFDNFKKHNGIIESERKKVTNQVTDVTVNPISTVAERKTVVYNQLVFSVDTFVQGRVVKTRIVCGSPIQTEIQSPISQILARLEAGLVSGNYEPFRIFKWVPAKRPLFTLPEYTFILDKGHEDL